MTVLLSPPLYSPDKFVNREEELSRLDRILESGEKRAVIFRGERGVGKSWLPAHWEWQLRRRKDLQVLRLDLKEYRGREPGWATADIIRRVSEKIGGPGERLGTDLAEMSRTLLQHVRKIRKTLILILDHVYESDWTLLALLEEYLLAPLISEPRVFIVLTGRGRWYPWRTPDLTIRAEPVIVKPLPSEEETRQQLERQAQQGLPQAGKIHRMTGGNPLANYLLAAEPQPTQVSDAVIEELLEPVPEEHRQKIREYLEALCVLRAFDEDRIPEMMAAYTGDRSYREWTYAQARQVRDELIRWALAQWDVDERAYVLDRIVRQLVELHLQQNHPDKWEALHQAARDLYERWAKEFPSTATRWEGERSYHQNCLTRQKEGER
ncbi:MAG: hypothetical protein H5T61_02945 [Thermoflexales bacterium]|nr:hypothetical protein [Thermoflexales bacterium]